VAINKKATLFLLAFPISLMGIILMFFALLSLGLFHDHEETQFFFPALGMIIVALILLLLSKGLDITRIGFRDALIFAVRTWAFMGLLGAIPIMLVTQVSFTDGVFESVSALTTTGATILTGLDDMPKSFLLFRQFLQWVGGLGVVIFVVAVLPMLNVGGMKLLKAETPGPMKDEKLSPRVTHTAHYLWLVYFTITIMCAIGYYFAGMSSYDAIAHSLSTVSTGGFSTHDASMGYFNNPVILIVADIFMVLAAISFALHFKVFRTHSIVKYLKDEETRIFLLLVFILSVITAIILIETDTYSDTMDAINYGTFHLISFLTSTGYGSSNFTEWPAGLVFLLVFASYLGGCAGSTAGGNKIVRNILSIKIVHREINRLIHPDGVFTLRYQNKPVDHPILTATIAFMTIVAFSSLFLTLLLMATGLDFWSSFTAVAACLNVLGPAFGELGNNFQPVNDVGTWILSFAMILGRLEYFTVLALFFPRFWMN
jgi:trk system potassium uptake protein TrkH